MDLRHVQAVHAQKHCMHSYQEGAGGKHFKTFPQPANAKSMSLLSVFLRWKQQLVWKVAIGCILSLANTQKCSFRQKLGGFMDFCHL